MASARGPSRAVCVAAALAGWLPLTGAPAPAAAGASAELAVGVSNAMVVGPPPDDLLHLGIAPLIGAVGWSAGERVSLGLRSATYLLPATVAGRLEPFLATFAGPAISVWPAPDLVIGAAIGPALVWPSPVGARPYLRANRGVGLSLRASWAVRRAAAGDVLVGAELLPTAFDGGDLLVGSVLSLGLVWR